MKTKESFCLLLILYTKLQAGDPVKSTFLKQDYLNWFERRGITFKDKINVKQLASLAAEISASEDKWFNIDLILNNSEYDIRPLWLPPYHCHFNPIELIWGIVKAYFEANVGKCGDSEEAMIRVWEEALDSITPEVWANCVRHTEELIEACYQNECQVESPDQTEYSQFKLTLSEDDFGIEDSEEDQPIPQVPPTQTSKRALPFAAGFPTSHSDPNDIVALSDDECDMLDAIQSSQDALQPVFGYGHDYCPDPVRYCAIAEQMGTSCQDETVMSTINKLIVRGKDIKSVLGTSNLPQAKWLNDIVIDAYLSLIAERSQKPGYPSVFVFSSFFYNRLCRSSYAGVQRHTIKLKKSLFHHDLVAIPINVGGHWVLATLDMRHKKISLYDSLGGRNHSEILSNLRNYFSKECERRRGHECPIMSWSADCVDTPLQTNGDDCGVFMCKFLEALARNVPLSAIGWKDMDFHRKLMAHELISGSLFPSVPVKDSTPNDVHKWPAARAAAKKVTRKRGGPTLKRKAEPNQKIAVKFIKFPKLMQICL
ncbi:uncharacterized protein LOC117653617 [Thrips palmi]|uniref:Uncharacterized protein LOC117653617 n=1 Tax=Thrips palmi TaxID=161013 RepID=A0A6P9ACU9_THRPL|nr:uncharacterized protein LOC117653617 [Thrips palmi]